MDRVKAASVFVCIVEQGSLTAAAQSLDMSRSMVTRYLAEVEDWAGARLLHRSTRQISLTSAGETVLANCQQLLLVADEVSATLDTSDAPVRGSLRISCPLSLGQDVLLPIFQTFLRRYPEVTLDLNIRSEAVNLIEERIDLAIRNTNDLDPNLIARKLGECRSIVCAAPAYLEQAGIPTSIGDLERYNCLTYSYFGKSLWIFNEGSKPASVPVAGNFTANDSCLLMKATLAGVGISLQPYYSAQLHIEQGNLVHLLPDCKPQTLGIWGVYGSRQHMPKALRTMIEMLAGRLARVKM